MQQVFDLVRCDLVQLLSELHRRRRHCDGLMTVTMDSDDLVGRLTPAVTHSQSVRDLFNSVPTAVAALCALVGGVRRGLIATSMSVGVSYDPPMIAFSVLNTSQTWPLLRTAPRIGVSVLSQEQAGVGRQIASRSADRFAGVEVATTQDGALFLAGATSWMDCSISAVAAAGDHELVVLQIHRVHSSTEGEPLLFHRSDFRRLEYPAASRTVPDGD